MLLGPAAAAAGECDLAATTVGMGGLDATATGAPRPRLPLLPRHLLVPLLSIRVSAFPHLGAGVGLCPTPLLASAAHHMPPQLFELFPSPTSKPSLPGPAQRRPCPAGPAPLSHPFFIATATGSVATVAFLVGSIVAMAFPTRSTVPLTVSLSSWLDPSQPWPS
jgi:hypothetical protein